MNRRLWWIHVLVLLAWGCSPGKTEPPSHEEHSAEPALPRGPHGGRLFTADGIQLELSIDEEDGPPIFIAYLSDGAGVSIDPRQVKVLVELSRFAGRRELIEFTPTANHLRSLSEVREPHSFRAKITAEFGGKSHEWSYEQVEFRLELSAEAITTSKIHTEPVGPRQIRVVTKAPGEVRLNAERVQLVRPRFPGVVSRLLRRLGDTVAPGDTLAVVQSNESLRNYPILAAIGGIVVARTAAIGSAVDNEDTIYTLADLSTVWVDFSIHPHDVGLVKRGQSVRIVATTQEGLEANATISYVGPLLEQDTRASYARVHLPNKDGRWQPGLYVIAEVLIDQSTVALAVPDAAIVRSRFGPAVFLAHGLQFEIQPVVTGRTDGVMTEILSGLVSGDVVVTTNAFLLKAELGKSEAKHDH